MNVVVRAVAHVEVGLASAAPGRELAGGRKVDAVAVVADADHALDAGAVGIADGQVDEVAARGRHSGRGRGFPGSACELLVSFSPLVK